MLLYRIILIIINLAIAMLNFIDYYYNKEDRYFVSGIIWLGAASGWLIQAIVL